MAPGFLTATCATIVLWLASFAGRAADPRQRADEALGAGCAACHGTGGHALPDSAIVGLAGASAAHLAEQMLAFRSGRRPGTVMPQLMRGYSDAQIERLARYFASQPAVSR